MNNKPLKPGWEQFREGFPWYGRSRDFLLAAYSEFVPPPRVAINPQSGEYNPLVLDPEDPYGWIIPELEEEYQLRPGLLNIGQQLMSHLTGFYRKSDNHLLGGHLERNLTGNPYFPAELLESRGISHHEQFVILFPLALSKTQDDLGRVRWTLFGSSEQGPEKAFWKSFFSETGKELPEKKGIDLITSILEKAYGEKCNDKESLFRSGFRILPSGINDEFPYWSMELLPSWTHDFLMNDESDFREIRFLLTFHPFTRLQPEVKKRYLEGNLHLLPCPVSMIPYGSSAYIKMKEQLPMAMQLPVLRLIRRHEGNTGIRIPQSAWMYENSLTGEASRVAGNLLLNDYQRTSRWDRVHRYEDAIAKSQIIHPVAKTLFSTDLEYMGLYNKPMARNCQLWNEQLELILNGPDSGKKEINKAALTVVKGGSFRYRFLFPPMQAGLHEVFWHRPLIGFIEKNSTKPEFITDQLGGYLTAYPVPVNEIAAPLELWPRIMQRKEYLAALHEFSHNQGHFITQTSYNLTFLFDTWQRMGKKPLDRSFAAHLLIDSNHHSFDDWMQMIHAHAHSSEAFNLISKKMESVVEHDLVPQQNESSLTYAQTANRCYETAYWNDILFLSHGKFINKDNADVVTDPATLKAATHTSRDLEPMGDYLLQRHRSAIKAAGMEDSAFAGELPFKWETDFDFIHFGGWKANQDKLTHERDLLVIIPGKNRKEVVILADHYDTAYMADVYDPAIGGSGARISAAGADDNDSATATLLQAAPVYLSMAKEGKLERDIWLLHLTGEEFPSDCLGARHFCKAMMEKKLILHLEENKTIDLSDVKIKGVFVMDMIAHNREKEPDVFQISPGRSTESLKLAYQAHRANMIWNTSTETWNQLDDRKGKIRGKRCGDSYEIPGIALYPKLKGEVRLPENPFSTLYNTDALMFSDCGIPVVLFMENYDISRSGYHDTRDTMANIDLDYGSAVSAIAIETAARTACLKDI